MPHKRNTLRDLRDDLKLANRFWAKVSRSSPDQCWPWTAARYWHGYGKIGIDGKTAYAHRIVWAMTRGPIPSGLDVLHRCDNPPCVNPAHLFLGDHSDNMRDRVQKGRNNPPQGSRNGIAKFTEDGVLKIRERWRNGEQINGLAREFGVMPSTIRTIVTYKRWKHVP